MLTLLKYFNKENKVIFQQNETQDLLINIIGIVDKALSNKLIDCMADSAKLITMVDLKNIYIEINHIIINLSQVTTTFTPKFFNICSEVLRFIRLFTEAEINNVSTADYFGQKFSNIPLKKIKAILRKYEVS